MIQNLSDRERNIRLALGVLMEVFAVISYYYNSLGSPTVFLAVGGSALIANYLTCFCGAKKTVNTLKSYIE